MGWGWNWPKLGLGLVVVAVALGGCDRNAKVEAPQATIAESATATAGATEVSAVLEEGGFRITTIAPARTARLSSQSAGAQINLRSQPTTQSAAKGSGISGDAVTLLQLAEGEGGFSWYYVKFAQSEAAGWVRGDFIDHSDSVAVDAPMAPTSTPPAAPAATTPTASKGPCGDQYRSEAFFETKSFTIHLCQTPQGLSYVGTNRSTDNTLTTTDVLQSQGTYIAINGNYQYHINDRSLVVYQVQNGSYTQIDQQAIVRHEKFLY
jgi:hypothetical protein